jgi:hypothetical protein
MGRRPFLGALCFGCAVLLTTASWAATIEPGQGNLSVNQGQGFQPINSRVDANVGDSVMVAPGGTATVVYSDGCKVDVQPGAVTTVAPLYPCATGSYAQDGGNAGGWIMGGAVLGVGAFAAYEAFKSTPSNSIPPSGASP